ncbi:probable glutathione S-transferase [Ricinus communis]|uniref:glutathione transferase n=1 Tax=Ricinus communis TaxID=3988 RepID=B9SDH9_RICCO|nr:probable glutathione S-transferase [Ricinus communis]EEF38416.1 glutathione s-transferase, putative [Ricinus communis]|eukprot:XP_002524048.1 probable glutathione S-transferase [Ricinus communis]
MAGQEEVKVLGGWSSPFVFRVEVALKLKGIQYEAVVENLANKSPELLKYNPIYRKIPVLVHNGKPISESLIIVEYIDETWKDNPILPQDPYERAMARFWGYFVDNKLMEALKGIIGSTEEEQKQKEVEKAKEALQVIEGELKARGKKFFGGDTIGFIDVALGWIPNWVGAVEGTVDVKIHDPEKFPILDEWMHNFTQVPVIKETLPQQDDLIAHFKQLLSYKLASAAGK